MSTEAFDRTKPITAVHNRNRVFLGVGWIRGHHSENSEAGRALLAAYALTRHENA